MQPAHWRWHCTTKRTRLPYSICPCQEISFRSHHLQHLQIPRPLLWHPSQQNHQGIRFQNCTPSYAPLLIRRKTILQVSTRPLAYHWKWSTTTQHLAHYFPITAYRKTESFKDILVHFRQAKPISLTFCCQWTPSIITTDILVISMRQYPRQLTPPHWHTSFDKGDLTLRLGASTNLKPTYTPLPSRISWSSAPCLTNCPSALRKSSIPNNVVWATNSGGTETCVQENWMCQTTWPHSTNQLQVHSTKGHHDTYMAQTCHLLNSQVLAIFSPFDTTQATLHFFWNAPHNSTSHTR